MQVSIQADDRTISNTMRERIERRIRFGLTRYEPDIRRVELSAGGKGLSGNADSPPIRVRVRMRTLPDVVVQDIASNLHSAVDRAVSRASRAVKLSFSGVTLRGVNRIS